MKVKDYHQCSNRIIWIRNKKKTVETIIIQVYIPTSTYEDDEVERVYEEIEDVLNGVKGTDNMILMGDWNAVVGEGKDGNIVGKYGLDKRNERRDRLVGFCTKHKLVTKAFHKRRGYMWAIPGDI